MLVLTVFFSLLLGWLGWRQLISRVEAANTADWGSKWLNRLDGLNRIFCHRFHGLTGETIRLPEQGGVLVASNHVSGLDPLLMIAASNRPLRFLIAREQYQRWYLTWLFRAVGCIPVERSTKPQAALMAAKKALDTGEVVALFPHGTIHLDHHQPRKLKRGVVWLGKQTGAPIYPLRIDGVRGKGLTVLSVWIPSRVRLQSFPRIECSGQDDEVCMDQLQKNITRATG
jgi:1-acyl-sn-glycerol-3-phosphate acyltransferase